MNVRLKVGALLAWALFSGGLASCGRASGSDERDEPTGSCQQDVDCAEGRHCNRELNRCVGCVDNGDCGGPDTCVDSECEAATGGTGPSGEGGLAGASNDPDPGTGATGGVGNGGSGAGGQPPEPERCEPGSRECDGPNVKRCSGDGSQWTIDDTCSLTQVCSSGACRDIECVPHRELCRDNQVWECGDDGTTAELVKHCKADQYCQEDDGDASCSATVCVPHDPLCNGQLATHCTPDGSGFAAGGQNCAETGELCYDGECRDRACTSGEKLCQHGDVYLCAEGGTGVALFSDCAETEACDATLGSCIPRVCEPGKQTCDGTRVLECNAIGTGWESAEECSLNNAVCVEGSCRAKLCTPYHGACKDDNAYQCDSLGVEYKLSEVCGAGRYCSIPYGTWANCANDDCIPGETVCRNHFVFVCNERGTIEGVGTPCGDGKVCARDAKSCTPQVCVPNTYFCDGKTSYYCYSDGLTTYRNSDCRETEYCHAENNSTSCLPYSCTPNTTACLGDQIGTCQADGLSLATVADDCTTASNVCNASLACAAKAVDQIGAAEDIVSYELPRLIGNSIDVHSSRKLTQLEANLVLGGTRDLHWMVYERVDGSSSYVIKLDKVISGQTGSGYFSSGPIDVTLQAGSRYVLAVMTGSGSVAVYFDAPPLTPSPSFGRFVAGIAAPPDYPYLDYYGYVDRSFDFRVTTAAKP